MSTSRRPDSLEDLDSRVSRIETLAKDMEGFFVVAPSSAEKVKRWHPFTPQDSTEGFEDLSAHDRTMLMLIDRVNKCERDLGVLMDYYDYAAPDVRRILKEDPNNPGGWKSPRKKPLHYTPEEVVRRRYNAKCGYFSGPGNAYDPRDKCPGANPFSTKCVCKGGMFDWDGLEVRKPDPKYPRHVNTHPKNCKPKELTDETTQDDP